MPPMLPIRASYAARKAKFQEYADKLIYLMEAAPEVADHSDLVKRLEIKAGVIEMGEGIQLGSDTDLMREAAEVLKTIKIKGERT